MKKFLGLILVVLVSVSSLVLSAYAKEGWVSFTDTITLKALTVNTEVMEYTRAGETYDYEQYKWTSGTANKMRLFVKQGNTIVIGKVEFAESWKGDGKYHKLYYNTSVGMGTNLKLYGEQSNVSSKTITGTFQIFYDFIG